MSALFTPSETYLLLTVSGQVDAECAKVIADKLADLKAHPQHVIVQLDRALSIDTAGVRGLMQLHQALKALDKQIRLVGVNNAVAGVLRDDGVGSSLKACASIRAALTELGFARTLDTGFINPFLTATMKVLELQTHTKATPGTPYKRDGKEKFLGDISGVIGLMSDAFSGSVVISFPAATFLKVMSRMLGEEFTEITKDIEDGAGELTNIIFGQAKIGLNEKGYGIKTAIPSVITGAGHSVSQTSNGPRVIIPFETDVGPFFVEICLSA